VNDLAKEGFGVIVNIASEAGSRGGCGGAIYSASRHGRLGLTRSTASGYRADGILFLASDLSAFVSGVVLPVDSGWNAG
jgi:NAD(P)-dependent dehydrogenase (short-subunit alcohol dehydrogenase family)